MPLHSMGRSDGNAQVERMLRSACKTAGSQKAWAEKYGLSAAYVSDVLNGRREPGKSILDALGLKAETVYRKL